MSDETRPAEKKKQAEAETATTTIRTDADVKLKVTLSPPKIDVARVHSIVYPNRPIIFRGQGIPDNYTLEIDFLSDGVRLGPFPKRAGDAANPRRGRYLLTRSAPEHTTEAAEAAIAEGQWKYQVVLLDPSGNDITHRDPVIIIRNGSQ